MNKSIVELKTLDKLQEKS